jgi:glutathione S-transferase
MLLYDLAAGMNPRRVRIFLAEKGITVPLRHVNGAAGENASAEFLKLNPLGKLPVLELDDGTVLTESVAICRYFEALHPEPALFGRGALAQAQVEMWLRRMEFELLGPMGDMFTHTSPYFEGRIEQLPAYADWLRPRVLQTMHWLDKELATREFIAGHHYSVADIAAQCALVLGKAIGLRVPAEAPHLARWFAAVTRRPTARA